MQQFCVSRRLSACLSVTLCIVVAKRCVLAKITIGSL